MIKIPKFDPFHEVEIVPKSANCGLNLLSFEDAQDTSACKTPGHFLNGFSRKCMQTQNLPHFTKSLSYLKSDIGSSESVGDDPISLITSSRCSRMDVSLVSLCCILGHSFVTMRSSFLYVVRLILFAVHTIWCHDLTKSRHGMVAGYTSLAYCGESSV